MYSVPVTSYKPIHTCMLMLALIVYIPIHNYYSLHCCLSYHISHIHYTHTLQLICILSQSLSIKNGSILHYTTPLNQPINRYRHRSINQSFNQTNKIINRTLPFLIPLATTSHSFTLSLLTHLHRSHIYTYHISFPHSNSHSLSTFLSLHLTRFPLLLLFTLFTPLTPLPNPLPHPYPPLLYHGLTKRCCLRHLVRGQEHSCEEEHHPYLHPWGRSGEARS